MAPLLMSLSSNQSVLVQVVKEPISTKGPRISAELLPEDL
jgi:Ribonuclease G/E